MKWPFQELPGDRLPRPAVPVRVAGDDTARHLCLLDTGSSHNRFARWVAEGAGVDLSQGEATRLAIGGILTDGITVSVALDIDGSSWQAPVTFCDPWPFGFHLLGQEGFFRFFHVHLRASAFTVEIQPDPGPAQS